MLLKYLFLSAFEINTVASSKNNSADLLMKKITRETDSQTKRERRKDRQWGKRPPKMTYRLKTAFCVNEPFSFNIQLLPHSLHGE